MAKAIKNLSKSKIMETSRQFPKYLAHYHGRQKKNASCQVHAHDFWQMELMLSGSAEIVLPERKALLEGGAIALISPGIPHGFHYLEDSRVTTIRLSLAQPLPTSFVLLEKDGGSAMLFSLIAAVTEPDNLSDEERLLLENLISAAAEISCHRAAGRFYERPVQMIKAIELVGREGEKPLTVCKVAKTVGCSAPYLSFLFKSRTGLSLKKHIDQVRMEFIARHMLYSDMSVSEIAERTGFPDIYTFSRFVRRETGKSPRAFRKGL